MNNNIDSNKTSGLLHIVLLLITGWHVYITITKYLANKFYTHDVGLVDYFLFNTYHGRFFESIYGEGCFWQLHFTPTLLLLVPLHAAFRHVLFLPILEALSVFSGAWACAWMTSGFLRKGKRLIHPFPALGLALGILYAANPLTGSVALSDHFESFALALSLWMMAALVNNHPRLFWILLLLTIGCKSEIGLYWTVFGAWWILWGSAALNKKRWFEGMGISFFSFLWFCLAIIVVAYFRKVSGAQGIPLSERYANLGKSVPEMAITLITHPSIFFSMLFNIGSITLPAVLFLPLLAPSTLLLLIPGACIMGLSGHFMKDLPYYYSYCLLPFIFLGVTLGSIRLIQTFKTLSNHRLQRRILTITIVIIAAGELFLPTRVEGKYRWPETYTPRHTWMRAAIRHFIPPDASVMAQFDLLCQVPHLLRIYPLSLKNMDRAEYWVLDKKGFLGDVSDVDNYRILCEGQSLVDQGKAKIIIHKDGFLIIRLLPQKKE